MGLRERMAKTATKLISKYGDDVSLVTIVTSPGTTEFDPPTSTPTETTVRAVVNGAGKYADGETILQTDLMILVSGEMQLASVGDIVLIDARSHTIIQRIKISATGVTSAVKYFARAG